MLASEIRVLSDLDRERIHEAALQVLEQAGMRIEENALRAQLQTRGASLAGGAEVRIPRELVAECLGMVHRTPILRSVNGKTLHHGPGDRDYHSLDTDP